ncbi:MAG: hypothetical protein ACTH07_08400 [Microbacterium sp.]
MTSDPWIIMPIAVIGLVLLACGVAGVVNLATVYTIRLPRRVPFPTIRRRALSMRDIIVPGILALLTGALISLASAFLFDGLTRDTTGSLETGVVIFVGVIVAFAIVSAVWFRSGMEIGDLAKDPSTIAAAAKSLHGASPDDANTLRDLHRNHQEWKERQGALALSPGTGRPSAAANAAMFRVLPRGRRPQQTRWALLGTLLRIRPLLTTGPIVTVVAVIVALSAIPEHAVPAAAVEAAALRAAIITVALLALLAVVFFWWSEIVCSARRYRIGRASSAASDIALAAAQSRISAARDHDRAMSALPHRIDRWGVAAVAVALTSSASLGIALRIGRR